MNSKLPASLAVKSLLIGSPVEPVANHLRWWLGSWQRFRHPELWEIYLEEKRIDDVLQQLLKSDSPAVDVGAHIGSFVSKLMRYAPNGKHIAFEPSEAKSRLLKRKYPNVEVLAMAVGESSGTSMFNENIENPGYSRLTSENDGDASHSVYEVDVCSLDEILGNTDRLDLLKMDIEGGELNALRGSVEIIEKLKPSIIFECGSNYFFDDDGYDKYKSDLYKLLTIQMNYNIYTYADYIYKLKPITYDEFLRCGFYPFRAFNFVAVSRVAKA